MNKTIISKSIYYKPIRKEEAAKPSNKYNNKYTTFLIWRNHIDTLYHITMIEHNSYMYEKCKDTIEREITPCNSWEEIRPLLWKIIKDHKYVYGENLQPRVGDITEEEEL